jgi:hypothetical protein
MTPTLEDQLRHRQSLEGRPGEHLGLERTMEALILAYRLQMIVPDMGDADALVDQEHVQGGYQDVREVRSRGRW